MNNGIVSNQSTIIKPWNRFWARYFDYISHALLISIIWMIIDFEGIMNMNNTLLSFILMVTHFLIDGIYMSFFGTTPGKKIMNIKVSNQDGTRLSKTISFKRSRLVWLRGMGLGVGIIEIIANIIGYRRLKKEGLTSWDKDLDLVVVHNKIGVIRSLICPICVIGFIFITIAQIIL